MYGKELDLWAMFSQKDLVSLRLGSITEGKMLVRRMIRYPAQSSLPVARSASNCGGVQKVFITACKTDIKSNNRPTIAPLTITQAAADRIKSFINAENKHISEYGLKVGIVKSGCSGNSYSMAIESVSKAKESGDDIFQHDGAQVFIPKKNMLSIFGSNLDYKESIFASGFEFDNPNIAKSCGCGSSFIVKKDARGGAS